MMARGCFERGRQAGVALVAVLWIVAALSILVTGMVQAQRDEIRLVASARQTAQGSALGSAAVQLALQQIASRSEPIARLSRVEVSFGGAAIPVEVVPLNGLIDLNRAPESLLVALLTVAGGMAPDAAAGLAKTLVAARIPGPLTRGGPRFEAVEDLLQLPGVDFGLMLDFRRSSRQTPWEAAASMRWLPPRASWRCWPMATSHGPRGSRPAGIVGARAWIRPISPRNTSTRWRRRASGSWPECPFRTAGDCSVPGG